MTAESKDSPAMRDEVAGVVHSELRLRGRRCQVELGEADLATRRTYFEGVIQKQIPHIEPGHSLCRHEYRLWR